MGEGSDRPLTDDAAILPLSVRPFGCRTCGGRSNSCQIKPDAPESPLD